jgi:hypothetical protein
VVLLLLFFHLLFSIECSQYLGYIEREKLECSDGGDDDDEKQIYFIIFDNENYFWYFIEIIGVLVFVFELISRENESI